MPPARLGGLRFYISSDDLFLPYAINTLLYTIVTAAFGTYYHVSATQYHTRAKHCPRDVFGKIQLLLGDGYVIVFIFTLQTLTSLGTAISASRGTILQMSKRKLAMPFAVLSTLLSILAFPFLGFFIYGVYSIGGTDAPCTELVFEETLNSDSHPIRALFNLCWVMLSVCICGPLLNLAILNLYPSFRDTAHGCCTGLVTCCGCTEVLEDLEGGDNSVQEDVVNIMQRIFAPMSMVASDLFAGMILLASYQGSNRQALLKDHKAQEGFGTFEQVAEKASKLLTPPSLPLSEEQVKRMSESRPFSPELGRPVKKATLLSAEYFLHFAQAAYGVDTTDIYGQLARSTVTNALSEASKVPIGRSVARSHKPHQTHLTAWERWFKEPFRGPFRKNPQAAGQRAEKSSTHRSAQRAERAECKKLLKWQEVLVSQLGLAPEEILDLRLENKAVGTVPYFIALDRIRNCIIVSIRGSYSLQDAFTDMITTAAPISALLNRGGLFGTPRTDTENDMETAYVPPSPTLSKEGACSDSEPFRQDPPPTPAAAGAFAAGAAGAAAGAGVGARPAPSGSCDEVEQVQQQQEQELHEELQEDAPAPLDGMASSWKAMMDNSEAAADQGPRRWDEALYPGGYGHRGIVLSAVRLLDDIRERGVLAEAVTKHSEMKVVITGHSLGAGLAALLAMALEPELSGRVTCWSFCPPGGLLNVDRAVSTASYVTTVVHAHDMVARLTWRAIERLRDEMMTAAALSKVNKNELWWRSLCYARDPAALHPDKLLSESRTNDPEVRAAVTKYNRKLKRQLMELGTRANLRFWAPGQIIYLRPLKADRDHASHLSGRTSPRDPPRIYDALWISFETLEAEGILVSPLAADDHILASAHTAICQALVRVSDAQASASESSAKLPVVEPSGGSSSSSNRV